MADAADLRKRSAEATRLLASAFAKANRDRALAIRDAFLAAAPGSTDLDRFVALLLVAEHHLRRISDPAMLTMMLGMAITRASGEEVERRRRAAEPKRGPEEAKP